MRWSVPIDGAAGRAGRPLVCTTRAAHLRVLSTPPEAHRIDVDGRGPRPRNVPRTRTGKSELFAVRDSSHAARRAWSGGGLDYGRSTRRPNARRQRVSDS